MAFTDPDTADTHTVAITGGNTGNAFTISNAGVITVLTPAAIDFETTSSFTLTVTVTDSGTPALSDTETVVINVNDVNDAPKIIDLRTETAALNDPHVDITVDAWMVPGDGDNSVITTMAATDEDPGDEPILEWWFVGPTDGMFFIAGIGPTAEIVLARPLSEATQSVYNLTVEVRDPAGLVDTGTVTITINSTTVGFVVDSQAVEASTTDVIEITFYRFDIHNNYASPLTVFVDHSIPATEPTPYDLAISDFDGEAAGLALLNTKQITIPANSQTVTVTLTAAGDSLIENIEGDKIRIIAPPSGANPYSVIVHETPAPGVDPLDIVASATLDVLDGWTLFADGVPGIPDGNAVYYDDIRQGANGDCYCLAAVAELAITHSSVIFNSLQRVGTTDQVTVRYYDDNGTEQSTTVVVNLDRGQNSAGLSGDYDSTGVEVWTWVIERAYAQTHGGYCNIDDGGLASHVWKWLTGRNASITYATEMTDQQIWDLIAGNFGTGNQKGVIVSSLEEAPELLEYPHVWAVVNVFTTGGGIPDYVELYNPHGSNVTVPYDRLDENVRRVFVGDY